MNIKQILARRQAMLGQRGFVLGPGVVDTSDAAYGHDAGLFKPEEYAAYLASSNAVYTCSTLRAELLASLPLKFYRKDGEENPESGAGELIKRVNSFWTTERLIRMTELSHCIWGEAFWFLDRGPSGKGTPKAIYWGRADRVRVVPHEEKYVAGYLYTPMGAMEPIPFTPQETVWMPAANIMDEFAGLAPLAAARLAADTASAAMKANRKMFDNGLHLGGVMMPASGATLSPDQATTLSDMLERRFKGVDKFHRWAVMQFEVQAQQVGVTPKDAEYLGGLGWALEDVCRAYHIPLDLVGGQRTLQNFEGAMKAVWTLAVLPQARFLAAEITEKLLPYFPDADYCQFDGSDISELQEAATERWGREREQLDRGVITINELRKDRGDEPVAWGDEPLVPGNLKPVSYIFANPSGLPAEPLMLDEPPEVAPTEPEEPEPTGEATLTERAMRANIPDAAPAYGSAAHKRLMTRFETRAKKLDSVFARKLTPLFEQQRREILSTIRTVDALATFQRQLAAAQGEQLSRTRAGEGTAKDPFDRKKWERLFREAMFPVYREIVNFVGQAELDDLSIALTFNISAAEVTRFLRNATQRFAKEVNETTWNALKKSLADGIEAGDGIAELADRVEAVMEGRIRSSKETIARTEVHQCYTGAQNEAWRQSEVVEARSWLATLGDGRTRDDHVDAHGQTVGLNDPFTVGGVKGDGPGMMGTANQDINCRCTTIAVLEKRKAAPLNGRLKKRVA